jgi:hypothetical protein
LSLIRPFSAFKNGDSRAFKALVLKVKARTDRQRIEDY